MYKKELEALLSAQVFPNYFLLYGADEYQIELYASKILSRFTDGEVLNLYFDEYDFNTAKAHLEQASLFSDSNILHVKSDKKIPAKELAALVWLCQKNPANAFVFEFFEADQKIAGDSAKAFGSNFARFFAPANPNEAADLLSAHAARLGITATRTALYKLYELQNENLNLCAAELNKYSAFTDRVDESVVERYSKAFGALSFDLFFQNLIAQKSIKKDFFTMIKDSNFNEMKLINSIYGEFSRLFKIAAFVKINGRFDAREVLGYLPPRPVAERLQRLATNFSTDDYLSIFRLLNDLEFDLKTKTGLEKESFLLSNLLALQETIAKNRKN